MWAGTRPRTQPWHCRWVGRLSVYFLMLGCGVGAGYANPWGWVKYITLNFILKVFLSQKVDAEFSCCVFNNVFSVFVFSIISLVNYC